MRARAARALAVEFVIEKNKRGNILIFLLSIHLERLQSPYTSSCVHKTGRNNFTPGKEVLFPLLGGKTSHYIETALGQYRVAVGNA